MTEAPYKIQVVETSPHGHKMFAIVDTHTGERKEHQWGKGKSPIPPQALRGILARYNTLWADRQGLLGT